MLFCFGFDIQKEALDNTKSLLEESGIDNFKLILDSHENILNYVSSFKGVVFNLGYLPKGDKRLLLNLLLPLKLLKNLTAQMKKITLLL